MVIYAFSGLGADERVFQYLKLDLEIIPVKWIAPEKSENLRSYCNRIKHTMDVKKPFALLGVSFGGVIVTELNSILQPSFSIIISSVITRSEIPFIYKCIAKMKLLNLLPQKVFIPPFFLAQLFFNAENKTLLKAILKDTDPAFAKWAVKKIINWKSSKAECTIIRLHGTNDRVFPVKEKDGIFFVEGGGHFMIVDEAEKLSRYINNRINKILLKHE